MNLVAGDYTAAVCGECGRLILAHTRGGDYWHAFLTMAHDHAPAPACPCGCPAGMHVGEIGCPCGLPDMPPCTPGRPAPDTRTDRGELT